MGVPVHLPQSMLWGGEGFPVHLTQSKLCVGGISCPSPHSMLWGGEGFPVHHPPLCWGWDFLSTFPPSIMGDWDFLSTFPHPCSASIPLSLCRPVQLSQLPGVLMRICLVISRKTVSLKSPTSFLLEVPSLRGGVCYLGLTL